MQCYGMTLPGPAASCLVIVTVIGLLLWMLGDSTVAIAMLVAEAIGWATLYTVSGRKAD
jgi:hypothetical protein